MFIEILSVANQTRRNNAKRRVFYTNGAGMVGDP